MALLNDTNKKTRENKLKEMLGSRDMILFTSKMPREIHKKLKKKLADEGMTIVSFVTNAAIQYIIEKK